MSLNATTILNWTVNQFDCFRHCYIKYHRYIMQSRCLQGNRQVPHLRTPLNCRWSWVKMVSILQTTLWNGFWMLLKFVIKDPVNKPGLVKIMACCRTGDIMWTNVGVGYWRTYASIGLWVHNFNAMYTCINQVTYTCVNKLTIVGSDNGLSPGRRQAIIWTCAEYL